MNHEKQDNELPSNRFVGVLMILALSGLGWVILIGGFFVLRLVYNILK